MALDIYAILNIIASICGMALFSYCIKVVYNILQLFPEAKMNKSWKIINILIIFFLFGYIVNIVAVIMNLTILLLIMTAFVYFFGALFVLIVVRLSLKTYKLLKKVAEE